LSDLGAERWARLRALFEQVAEQDEDARRARIAVIRRDDPELADRLEELLEADAREASLDFSGVVAAGAGAWLEEIEPTSSREALPAKLGPWRLGALLGRGGMAEVFAAERVDGQFEQRAALKLLKRGMDSKEIVARFLRERRILARLEHPAIARILDGGLAPDGRPYLVMERIDGEPITEWCETQAAPLERRLRLLVDTCRAVAAAHRLLVVHRDLKPSNILVSADGAVKLLDFGIAKLLDPEELDGAATRTEQRVLTPAYAAPEQILGEPITTASDVYSLGVLAYELLTGRLPHRRGRRSAGELVSRAAAESIERPSAAVLMEDGDATGSRRLDAGERRRRSERLRGDLDTILLTALRREPERRYGSVEALAEDLERYLDGRPIAARADNLAYRARKFIGRHRVGVAAAALALAALLAALGLALQQAHRAERAAAAARSEATRAEQQAHRAERARDLLASVFEAADPVRAQGHPPSARQLLDEGARRVDRELGDEAGLHGEMLDLLAGLYRKLGELEPAEQLARRALELRRAAAGPDSPEVGRSLQTLGWTLLNEGKLDPAREALERSVEILDRTGGEDEVAAADAREPLVELEFSASGPPAALPVAEKRLEIYRRRLGDGDPKTAIAWNDIGVIDQALGRFDDAEAAFRRSLEVLDVELSGDDPRRAYPHNNLIPILINRGHFDEAEREARTALEIRERSLGPSHPDTGWTVAQSANIYIAQERWEEALAAAERAYAIFAPSDRFNALNARKVIAVIEQRRGRPEAALPIFEQVVPEMEGLLGPRHPLVLGARIERARCRGKLRRHDEALAELHEVAAVLERPSDVHSELRERAQSYLGDELVAAGQLGEALTAHRLALSIAGDRLGAGAAATVAHAVDVARDLLDPAAPGDRGANRGEARQLLTEARDKLRAGGMPDAAGLAEIESLLARATA